MDVVWDNETIAVQRFEIASYAEQKNCFPEVNVQYSFFHLARLFLLFLYSVNTKATTNFADKRDKYAQAACNTVTHPKVPISMSIWSNLERKKTIKLK